MTEVSATVSLARVAGEDPVLIAEQTVGHRYRAVRIESSEDTREGGRHIVSVRFLTPMTERQILSLRPDFRIGIISMKEAS